MTNALPLIGSDLVQKVRADVADGPRIIDNDHPGFNEIDRLISLNWSDIIL